MRPSTTLSCAALLAIASATTWAQTEQARVVQARGSALVDGEPVRVGQPVGAALLSTGPDGRLQLRMTSGALVALPPSSQVRLPAGSDKRVALLSGGLRLNPAGGEWTVEMPNRSIRSNGFLTLQDCSGSCVQPHGLYGRVAQGEAVLEYQGGRSVLRSRSFRWVAADTRPEVLALAPALLSDVGDQAEAARARSELGRLLKSGIEAFGAGDDPTATRALEQVRAQSPGETLVPYYLGLIALRREDSANALTLLQQYAREDPEGAASREVPKMLTLLSSTQLQQEVATAVAREREVVGTPPEPGSIAVQAFVNRGDEAFRAMAKGLAAMVIADLTKVPGLKVLEREKVQLLVNEAKLGDSGLADTASAVRSGRLMRAERVVVGNLEVQ